MSLKLDSRQHMIYNEPAMGAVIRGLEVWALMVLGTKLRNRGPNRNKALNGIGAFCQKVAQQRIVEMKRNGGAQEVMADWVLLVSKWAAGKSPLTPDVDRALKEIYWTVFKVDSVGTGAGMLNDNLAVKAIRGD